MRTEHELTTNHPAEMDFKKLGESVRASYRDVAARYRMDDEIEITTEHHRRLSGVLKEVTASFGRPITVLDVGCGTGRYFYCLRNVRRLIGMDLSEEMLQIAHRPVRHEDVSIGSIDLRCENAHFASFPSESFDFIYSLGMFGNGCPVTVTLCNHFYNWLKPGGQLFFNVVGVGTMPLSRRLRRSARMLIYPWLPQPLKNRLDARETGVRFFGLGKRELERILRASHFKDFSVSSHACNSQLWRGVHLDCRASTPLMAGQSVNRARVSDPQHV